jgi:hypothetical protein
VEWWSNDAAAVSLVLDLIRVLVLGWWIEASRQDRRGSEGVMEECSGDGDGMSFPTRPRRRPSVFWVSDHVAG